MFYILPAFFLSVNDLVLKLYQHLNNISEYTGQLFSWSTALLVLTIFIDVIIRYVFDYSYIWIVELEIYFFAITFLFGSAYAFKHDKHVRVDIFYAKKTEKQQAYTNLLGGVFLLMPWCIVSIMGCYKYFELSWKIGERSAQPGGLPALYILKFFLVLSFVFLLIQAIASILKSWLIIRNKLSEPVDTLTPKQ